MRSVLLVAFCLLFISAKAQFVPMQQTIKTPYGPAKITTYSHQPYMYRPYGMGASNRSLQLVFKTNLTIIAKDGTVSNLRVEYDASSQVHLLKERGNKSKEQMIYKPSDTKQISRFYDGKLQVGIPADSCWLFKYYTGKVIAYSYLPGEQKESLLAIQSGKGGPILPLTKENLLTLVPDANERVLKLIEDEKFWRAIEVYNKPDKNE